MKRDVLINIRGIQRIDNEKDVTELFTQGKFYRQNGNYYITYDESEATGFEGCKTTLKVEADKITLIRSGTARSHLIVERGARNLGRYGTAAGDLMIGVNAKQVCSGLTDEGGELYFSYSLDVNSSLVSENEVFIEVKQDTGTAPVPQEDKSTGMEYPL
jgi:uncharacterized beta-barrel protein YwiB (DUF1934 family)